MAAGVLPITIERNARFHLRYFVKRGGSATSRPLTVAQANALPAYDLTGFTAAAQVRESPESSVTLATMTCVVTTPGTGEINITLAEAITALMPLGVQHWDCFITSVGTGPIRLLAGRATVVATDTR